MRWKRDLVVASALVCAVQATSFATSLLLPGTEDRSGCYWQNPGWVPFVVCNLETVTAPGLLELFYNAWLYGLLYSLLFAPAMPFVLIFSLISWGSVAVVVRALWRWTRRSRSEGQN